MFYKKKKAGVEEQITDTEAIFYFHQYKIRQFQNRNHRALGWRDLESQRIRFKVLAQIANLNHASVLDAGCGHGDLREYLNQKYTGVQYHGMEQIPEFLDLAQLLYGHLPGTAFYQGNFMTDELPAADYTLINGSLNYRNTDAGFIFNAIKRLFSHSRLGLGFNLLSHIPANDNLVAYPPDKILAYCRTLSNRVAFKDDYADEDYTIFMYR